MDCAEWVKCNGEAHSNPFIDNCGVCMPFWEEYPVCPTCRHFVDETVQRGYNKNPRHGYCRTCKKYYSLERK